FKRPVFYPFDELPIAGDVGKLVIMGQIPPAAAGRQHVEQAVNCFIEVGPRPPSFLATLSDNWLK
ncbi:MAG: hypothetical protein UW11_C0008G0001, partial [Parcubacteria group bacterium GW2011_GWA2_43_9b]